MFLLNCPRVVILDIDGTLANTNIDWIGVRKILKEKFGVWISEAPLAENIVKYLSGRELEEALRIIEDIEMESARALMPDEELRNILKDIKMYGIKISVVTYRSRRSAIAILKQLRILDLIDYIVTRDYSNYRVQQLKYVLNSTGSSPRDVVFISDKEFDCRNANLVGIKSCYVVSSGSTNELVPKETKLILRKILNNLSRCY